MSKYEVVVGNIGLVCATSRSDIALDAFVEYVSTSKANVGMAGNEPVTMMLDGEIVEEHIPSERFECAEDAFYSACDVRHANDNENAPCPPTVRSRT